MRKDDLIPKKRMAEALDSYMHGDDAFMRQIFGGETPIGRSLVHETALAEDVPDVLDWERATAIVHDARACAVATCYVTRRSISVRLAMHRRTSACSSTAARTSLSATNTAA